MRNGRIPEKVTAYIKKARESLGEGSPHNCWGFPPDLRETPRFSKFSACPAFVAPSDSNAWRKTGAGWASESCYGQNPKPFSTQEIDNKPFRDLRWVGVESRSEGGVAYKVLTPQGWLVDLREDVVIECLYEGAIEVKDGPQGAGTYFTAEFVWAAMGSQSRLVRFGSQLHADIVESQSLREKGPIPANELEIGGIYERSNGTKVAIIDIRGKKFLVMEHPVYFRTGVDASEEAVKDSVSSLGADYCRPDWRWMGSLSVVRKIGKVDLPAGLGERYDRIAGYKRV